ncbi:MAG: hypothetical protein GY746_17490 [Gammaproteobacteria bacterium]|nr:hypothetical protein [Gammaproteobacteria bacterium]
MKPEDIESEFNACQHRDYCRQLKKQASTSDDLLCAAADLLDEAAECIALWGVYADEYFQDKHDLNGDVDRFKKYVELLRKQIGT